MFMMTRAPALLCTLVGPDSYQMSSHTFTPTHVPLISKTGHSLPDWKYRFSSKTL